MTITEQRETPAGVCPGWCRTEHDAGGTYHAGELAVIEVLGGTVGVQMSYDPASDSETLLELHSSSTALLTVAQARRLRDALTGVLEGSNG
ncbi:hypothetical protein CGZ94_20700 [Enemella evansiae]|uniref:Uncharacterized protein n=1 Tax=Enemella evansiae TaxID=2016499 RepID=A0A255FX72_9ACTN|nr:hypothetical protein [Enemella evansiae]OYO07891.1 hypothetical protein CGZ94_20700 [Enemella evansiae]